MTPETINLLENIALIFMLICVSLLAVGFSFAIVADDWFYGLIFFLNLICWGLALGFQK